MATRPHSSAARLSRDIKAVNWARLSVGEALDLLMAMEEARASGAKVVADIVNRIRPAVSSAQPQVQQSSPPPVFPPTVEQAPSQLTARLCSICGDPGKPLMKERLGPWVRQGMCESCFADEQFPANGREP